MSASSNPVVLQFMNIADRPYPRTFHNPRHKYTGAMALAGPALALADIEAAALAEQTKVSAALLFESVCEYPHNMAQYENPAANDFLTQENLRGNFNCLGAYLNELFWSSVRFRNYMRYGVAQQLLNRQVGDAAGAAEEQFDYPTLTMLNGIPMFSWTTGLPPQNLANSHLPWNKILPNGNADPARRVRPMQSTANYSAFDISSSVFSNMGADPGGWVNRVFHPVPPTTSTGTMRVSGRALWADFWEQYHSHFRNVG